MKLKDLIAELQPILEKYPEVEVVCDSDCGYGTPGVYIDMPRYLGMPIYETNPMLVHIYYYE